MLKTAMLCVAMMVVWTGATCCAGTLPERTSENQKVSPEETAEREGNNEKFGADFCGKLALFTKEQKEAFGDASVFGTLTTDKTTYFVKLNSEKLLEALTPYDGKKCTLTGKLRNEGKYLLVQKVVQAGAEYIYQKRRGGVGM